MRIRAVLRFWNQGQLVDRGEELDVDESLGQEVILSGKAVPAEPPAQSGAPPQEDASET